MAKKIPAQAFYEEYHGHRVEHLRHLVTLSSVSAPASVDFRGETVSLKMGRPSQLHLRKVHESTVLFLKQFSKIGAFNLGYCLNMCSLPNSGMAYVPRIRDEASYTWQVIWICWLQPHSGNEWKWWLGLVGVSHRRLNFSGGWSIWTFGHFDRKQKHTNPPARLPFRCCYKNDRFAYAKPEFLHQKSWFGFMSFSLAFFAALWSG